MRQPGWEDEDEADLNPAPFSAATEKGFVEACQQLIREICEAEDTSIKAMKHAQLTERLMRKR
jgi:hypothetical protein